MRILNFFAFLILINLCLNSNIYSQESDFFDPLKDDISSRIPSLEALIDSAISNDPQLKYRDQQNTISEYKLRSKRVEWTRNIGVQANTGYGNLYNYSSTSTGAIDPAPVASTRSQSQYNASFYINLPFSTIVDRNNQLQVVKAEINQAQNMLAMQRKEIRQQVILHYNDLVLKQRILSLKAKNLESIKMNMQMGEKEFLNGIIPISEFTNISSSVSDSEVSFENARMEFLNAYMMLEELVGVKFNLFKTTPGNNEHN